MFIQLSHSIIPLYPNPILPNYTIVGTVFVCFLQISSFVTSPKCQTAVIVLAFVYFSAQITFATLDLCFGEWTVRKDVGDGFIARVCECNHIFVVPLMYRVIADAWIAYEMYRYHHILRKQTVKSSASFQSV